MRVPCSNDDFDSFFSFFLGSIEPGADLNDFFIPCGRLVADLVRTGHLPGAIADRTQEFLHEWLPRLIVKTSDGATWSGRRSAASSASAATSLGHPVGHLERPF
jgi:hypothetical protein